MTERFVLFLRERTPLERDRGGSCLIAVSDDGIAFDQVWAASKRQFAANSIEVGHCVRHDADEWRLYVSYEFAGSGTWRIDVLRAAQLDQFDTQSRRTVLDPGDYGLAWVKDPFVLRSEPEYRLYVAGPPRTEPRPQGGRLAARPREAALLAESADGLYFPALEYVMEPTRDGSWHGNRARINSLFRLDGEWVATYDGGQTSYDNYEEWCGLAVTEDGHRFERIPMDQPWIRSQHGSVRYVYGLPLGDRVFFYYEYTTEDLSHELRVSVVDV